jgi:hypothetical protein
MNISTALGGLRSGQRPSQSVTNVMTEYTKVVGPYGMSAPRRRSQPTRTHLSGSSRSTWPASIKSQKRVSGQGNVYSQVTSRYCDRD